MTVLCNDFFDLKLRKQTDVAGVVFNLLLLFFLLFFAKHAYTCKFMHTSIRSCIQTQTQTKKHTHTHTQYKTLMCMQIIIRRF